MLPTVLLARYSLQQTFIYMTSFVWLCVSIIGWNFLFNSAENCTTDSKGNSISTMLSYWEGRGEKLGVVYKKACQENQWDFELASKHRWTAVIHTHTVTVYLLTNSKSNSSVISITLVNDWNSQLNSHFIKQKALQTSHLSLFQFI